MTSHCVAVVRATKSIRPIRADEGLQTEPRTTTAPKVGVKDADLWEEVTADTV